MKTFKEFTSKDIAAALKSAASDEGYTDYHKGRNLNNNPHKGTVHEKHWIRGWKLANKEKS